MSRSCQGIIWLLTHSGAQACIYIYQDVSYTPLIPDPMFCDKRVCLPSCGSTKASLNTGANAVPHSIKPLPLLLSQRGMVGRHSCNTYKILSQRAIVGRHLCNTDELISQRAMLAITHATQTNLVTEGHCRPSLMQHIQNHRGPFLAVTRATQTNFCHKGPFLAVARATQTNLFHRGPLLAVTRSQSLVINHS